MRRNPELRYITARSRALEKASAVFRTGAGGYDRIWNALLEAYTELALQEEEEKDDECMGR